MYIWLKEDMTLYKLNGRLCECIYYPAEIE